MKLESVRVLRGANIWRNGRVLEAQLVLGAITPVADPAAFVEACRMSPVPAAREALRTFDVRNPAWPELLGILTWALQPRLPESVAESAAVRVSARDPKRAARVIVAYVEEAVATGALDLAFRWMRSLMHGTQAPNVGSEYAALCGLDQSIRLGPSTLGIVRAAEQRGIPVRRLTNGSLVQFGHGARQRRVWAAETDATSSVAESIAQDKELTKRLLAAADLPVPRGFSVRSGDEAWTAAQAVGLPVVVKPRNGNQGKGVSVGLKSESAVREAFDEAVDYDGCVLVEQHIEGGDFRLLVVGNKLVAAASREVPAVLGDGTSSISRLVAIENQNPLRGEGHATALSKLLLDGIAEEVLAAQGLTAESVPGVGRRVVLRRNANLSTGGTATDVTDSLHPDVARAAIEAARVVGLDIAGIDLVARDITCPLSESQGAMVEVNAAPGLRMHLEPSQGRPQPVGEAIIDHLFAPGSTGRIPIVAVTGTNGKTTTTRAIAHLLRLSGLRVGMTCTDGVYIENRRIDIGDSSGPKSARIVLAHPNVDAAVLETARGGILREGLGFDRCDVAVVTNLGAGDHLGMGGIETVAELAHVKATIVRSVSTDGAAVLNAEDPEVVVLAEQCPGEVIFFSKADDHPVILQHRASGGRTVTVRDGVVCFCRAANTERLVRVVDLPLTFSGLFDFQTENLLAVAATGWYYGFPAQQIAVALSSFASDADTVPGRMNVLRHRDSLVILDYGHNASALVALTRALSRLPHARRKVVYTAAGDRRDEDICGQARILAEFFDEIFIYEDQCTRGRKDGEVMALMRQGFRTSNRTPNVIALTSELAAIDAAIRSLQAGDVLLCQVDQVDLDLEFVGALLRRLETSARRAADEPRGPFDSRTSQRVSALL